MTLIPKAFQGCDLTGWTVQRHGFGIVRFTVNGDVVQISERFECEDSFDVNFTRQSGVRNAFIAAEDIAESYGGWAPAPIGSDPGWQPIETAPKDGTWFLAAEKYEEKPVTIRWSTNRTSRIGMPINPGFVGDTSNVTVHGDAYMDCDIDEQWLTHWRPLPAPPEAKQ